MTHLYERDVPRPCLEPEPCLLICDQREAAKPPCPAAPTPYSLPGATKNIQNISCPALCSHHVLSPCPLPPRSGNLEQAVEVEAVLSAGRLQLEQLWLRLATPGPLAGQLRRLQKEAEQQQEKIQAFESDLAEIRADKQNLEDILRSLPESCSK